MASGEKFIKVVLLMPATEMESLRSFVDYSGGEICSESGTRKRPRFQADSEANSVQDEDDAGGEIPHYSLGALSKEGVSCRFCLQLPCVTTSDAKAAFLFAHGAPRPQNITKRFKDYKEFYRMLKKSGLWENAHYLEKKQELGIFIEDVREVLPICVVTDVRKRWPNPADVPYKGHVPSL